jgi:hypothetical protein
MNKVIEKNNARQGKAIIQLGVSVGKGDKAQAIKACNVLMACLDDYEAEIIRLEKLLEEKP